MANKKPAGLGRGLGDLLDLTVCKQVGDDTIYLCGHVRTMTERNTVQFLIAQLDVCHDRQIAVCRLFCASTQTKQH